jgi:hypothetical protein
MMSTAGFMKQSCQAVLPGPNAVKLSDLKRLKFWRGKSPNRKFNAPPARGKSERSERQSCLAPKLTGKLEIVFVED